ELVSALDDNRFEAREKATRELETFGDSVEAMLRQAQKSTDSVEARSRLARLISLAENRTSPNSLRDRRAIAVLEKIGTREAPGPTETVAPGLPDAGATRDARTSLERLAASRATKEQRDR